MVKAIVKPMAEPKTLSSPALPPTPCLPICGPCSRKKRQLPCSNKSRQERRMFARLCRLNNSPTLKQEQPPGLKTPENYPGSQPNLEEMLKRRATVNKRCAPVLDSSFQSCVYCLIRVAEASVFPRLKAKSSFHSLGSASPAFA